MDWKTVFIFPAYLSRPVLIVGTFANQIIAKLSKDFPYKFYRFIPGKFLLNSLFSIKLEMHANLILKFCSTKTIIGCTK